MSSLVGVISSLSQSGLLDNKIIALILTIVIVIGVVTVGTSFIVDLIKNLKESLNFLSKFKTKGNHFSKEAIDAKLKIDDKIEEVAKMFIDSTPGVNRVSIYQFHNGTKTASKMPFHYCVLTNETCSAGIAHSKHLNRHDDMRIYSYIIKHISVNPYFYSKVSDLQDPLVDIFAENGSKYIKASIIADALNPNILIGMVILESMNEEIPEETKDTSPTIITLDHFTKILSGLLCNVIGRCKYCVKHKKCKIKSQNVHEDCRYFSTIKDDENNVE